MLNDRIAALMARKLSGEATPDELQQLSDHFELYPADQYFEELLTAYWFSKQEKPQKDSSDEHINYLFLLAQENAKADKIEVSQYPLRITNSRVLIKRLTIAAVIAGISFIVWKFVFPRPAVVIPKHELENEVTAKKGTRSRLLLPDGSQVWLNSDSRLIYSNSFNDTIREVELEGEAYFDVIKDPRRPFIVHASSIDIRALGTAFDVKSYPGESTIETTLIRGLIEVTKKDQPGAAKIILRPHEKLTLDRIDLKGSDTNEKKKTKELVNAEPPITKVPKNLPDTSIVETSWVYDKLLFTGQPFRDAAVKMERWFNVKITFRDDKVANNCKPTGSFTTETIDEALQALQLIYPFQYKKIGNEIEIDKSNILSK